MDAIVIAGGIPQPGEPLYEYTQGAPKAMLDVAGKPMIQWVLDALNQANTVERVVLVGLPLESEVQCPKLQARLPNRGSMLEHIRMGVSTVLEINPQASHVMLCSSDIPGITPEMVNWVVNTAMQSDDDVYYTIVPRSIMETRYPGSRRSYTRLKDMEVCGGDINIIRAKTATEEEALWERIIAARKNVFKQAALIGYGTLILLLLRQIDLEHAVRRACRRLKVRGRALVSPYAELAMDIDKPHQLEIMRADLAQRGSA